MSDKRKRGNSKAGGKRQDGSRLSQEQRRTGGRVVEETDAVPRLGSDKGSEQEFRYTRSMYGPSGRVPPVDAFDHVPRRMPPPHVREQLLREAEEQRARQEAAGQKSGSNRKKKRKPPAAKARGRQAAPAEENHRANGNYQEQDEARPNQQAQAAKRKKKTNRKKKRVVPQKLRRRRRILSAFLVIILITGGVIFSFRMLFKIESFKLVGESPYSKQQIMQFFTPQTGDNLFGFSKKNAEQRIETSLPYISSVKITRILPHTVVFTVTQAGEKYYMPWNGSYAVLSDEMKVLKFSEEKPEQLIGLLGLPDIAEPVETQEEPETAKTAGGEPGNSDAGEGGEAGEEEPAPTPTPEPTPEPTPTPAPSRKPGESPSPEETPDPARQMKVVIGYPLGSENDDAFKYLDMMIMALSKSVLWEEVTWIDIKDPLSIQFRWQDRVTVFIGSQTGIEEKVNIAQTILTDEVEDAVPKDAKGTLDVSTYPETLRASYWDD